MTNLFFPVGNGHRILLKALLVGVAVLFTKICVANTNSEAEWTLLNSLTLKPLNSLLLKYYFHGGDVALMIIEADDHQRQFVQDGPNNYTGVEVVGLTNGSAVEKTYQIFARQKYRGLAVSAHLDIETNPSATTVGEAADLSHAGALWAQGSQFIESTKTYQRLSETAQNTELQQIATLNYACALMQLQRSKEANAIFANYLAAKPQLSLSEYLYIRLLRALNFTSLEYFEEANTEFADISALSANLESSTQTVFFQEWLKSEWAKAEIIQGFYGSDIARMWNGRQQIEQSLNSIADYEPSPLAARLYSYLALHDGFKSTIADAERVALLESSLALYQQARLIYDEVGKTGLYITVLNNIAFTYQRLGELGKAQQGYIHTYLEAKKTAPLISPVTISQIARTYKTNGDYYRAKIYLQEAIDEIIANQNIIQEFEFSAANKNEATPQQKVEVLNKRLHDLTLELGEIQRESGQLEAAIATHERVRKEVEKNPWQEGILRVYTELIKDNLSTGNVTAAKAHVSTLLSHREQAGFHSANPRHGLDAQIAISEAFIQLNDLKTAKQELIATICRISPCDSNGTITAFSTEDGYIPEREKQLQMLYLLGQVYQREGSYEDAVEIGKDLVRLIESSRDLLGLDRQGATWSANTDEITSWFVILLLDHYQQTQALSDFELAFDYLQRVRAMNFRTSRMANIERMQASAALENNEGAVRSDVAKVQADLLVNSVAGGATAELETAAVIAEDEQKHKVAASLHPTNSGLLRSITLAELQARLGEEQGVAVSMVLGERTSYQIIVRPNEWQIVQLAGQHELTQLINTVYQDLSIPNTQYDYESARRLSRQLLNWVSDQDIKDRKIYLEAPAIIQKIPFAALTLENDEHQPFALVSMAEIIYTPSLSGHFVDGHNTAGDNSGARTRLTVIADPAIDALPAIVANEQLSAINADTLTANLRPLSFTANEIANISTLWPESTTVYVGKDASLEKLLSQNARQSQILHIASHGFSDQYNPQMTGLLLSGNEKELSSYFLTLNDIESQQFNADLVVLSACGSGSGELLGSEGIAGLSRAFLVQGAKATVSTLWPVSDRATSVFMGFFYRALAGPNANTASALRQAKLQMQGNRRYRHPYYWAGFVLAVADSSSKPIAR